MRIAITCAVVCGCGNTTIDYPPPPLHDLGLHQAPTYVARHLLAPGAMVIAHPRLGQPAIVRAGEAFDVAWIANGSAVVAQLSLDGGAPIVTGPQLCDRDGVCHAVAVVPAVPPRLYGICAAVGVATTCVPSAIAVVADYANPATVVHISDAHIGDDGADVLFGAVVDRINALDPAPDFAVFTGDGANDGLAAQRATYIGLLRQLQIPTFVVTGNHDYEHAGIDGYLLEVGPELDYAVRYGDLRVIGLSSGQDLDDGNHLTTISESSAPDDSQLDWLAGVITDRSASNVVLVHHPIYNALFATIGPDARDRLRALVTRDDVLAVLTGHTHVTAAFDIDGNSRGLSLDGEAEVPVARWPLHYGAARSTNGAGGFAVLHLGPTHVDYRWVSLE